MCCIVCVDLLLLGALALAIIWLLDYLHVLALATSTHEYYMWFFLGGAGLLIAIWISCRVCLPPPPQPKGNYEPETPAAAKKLKDEREAEAAAQMAASRDARPVAGVVPKNQSLTPRLTPRRDPQMPPTPGKVV